MDKYTREVIKTLWTLLQADTGQYNKKTRDVLFAITRRQYSAVIHIAFGFRGAKEIIILTRFACKTPGKVVGLPLIDSNSDAYLVSQHFV